MGREEYGLRDRVDLAILEQPLRQQQRKRHDADQRTDRVQAGVLQRIEEVVLDKEQLIVVVQRDEFLVRLVCVALEQAQHAHVDRRIDDERSKEYQRRKDHQPGNAVALPRLNPPTPAGFLHNCLFTHHSCPPRRPQARPVRHDRCACHSGQRSARAFSAP